MKEGYSNWRKLDNAALAFPLVTGKNDTRVFRFYCELKENVKPELLQTALEKTMEKYPLFQMVLRKGLFWFYLEHRDIRPIVKEEKKPPCSRLYIPDKKNLLFQVSYYEKRINFEEHCDRLGILVWQDMPSGDNSPKWIQYNYFDGKENERSIESEENFKKEWREIMDYLMPYPSIVVWVPFNEAWGQFKTKEIAEWTEYYDPSRLVNAASGGNHYYKVGDILDIHRYPRPELMMYEPTQVNVVGEYGGIGLPMKGHLWQPNKNWGYVQFKNTKEVTDEYVKFGESLLELVPRGVSGAVYTQTTDVEVEVNGLMTYDRKAIKIEEERVREINKKICNSLSAE